MCREPEWYEYEDEATRELLRPNRCEICGVEDTYSEEWRPETWRNKINHNWFIVGHNPLGRRWRLRCENCVDKVGKPVTTPIKLGSKLAEEFTEFMRNLRSMPEWGQMSVEEQGDFLIEYWDELGMAKFSLDKNTTIISAICG